MASKPPVRKKAGPRPGKVAKPVRKAKTASGRRVAKGAPASGRAAFGRAGTAGKAEGHDAILAWIKNVKPEHRDIVRRVDALVLKTIPKARCAIKWSMPMYGLPGQGWLIHMASYKSYVAVGFFAGTSLEPQPAEGESGHMRRTRIPSAAALDERQMKAWIEQAAQLPGWGTA